MLQNLLAKTVRELRDGRVDSLVNMVEEEYRKKELLQNTINRCASVVISPLNHVCREMDASRLLKQLQEDLIDERRLLEEENSERDQIIQQLKDTIQEVKLLTHSEQKYIKKETRAREVSIRTTSQRKETMLNEEKTALQQKIHYEQKAHQVMMEFLTAQRDELDIQIQEWMTNYEEGVERKAQELESLKLQRTQDMDRYDELAVKYEALEKQVEEERLAKQREEEHMRQMEAMIKCAVRLQRWWRRLRQSRKSKSRGKSSKKGKKGGKKK